VIVNLTPHPLHIYAPDTPDRITAGSVTPLRVLPPSPSHQPARLGHQVIGEQRIDDDLPVALVAFGRREGRVSDLPEPRKGTWYVVSLVVGLAAAHRDDLLVLHEYVRDLDGRVIGSRGLARPVAAAAAPANCTDAVPVATAVPTPGKPKPWCNYAIHRTTSSRRDSGSRTRKMPHGVSRRRWLRRVDDWWHQRDIPTAALPGRLSQP
jgi:hypothetical protein